VGPPGLFLSYAIYAWDIVGKGMCLLHGIKWDLNKAGYTRLAWLYDLLARVLKTSFPFLIPTSTLSLSPSVI